MNLKDKQILTNEPLQKENLKNFLSKRKENIDFLALCLQKNNYFSQKKTNQKIYITSIENGFYYLSEISLNLESAIQRKSRSEISHCLTLMKYYIKMLNTYYFTEDTLKENSSF